MDAESQRDQDKTVHWRSKAAPDHVPVEHGLPVLEESIVQTGPGKFAVDTSLVATGDAALVRVVHNVKSVGVTVVDPAYASFAIPVNWRANYSINGQSPKPDQVFRLDERSDSLYCAGEGRDILGVILRRDRFVEAAAALLGKETVDADPGGGIIHLPSDVVDMLRHRLARMLDAYPGSFVPERFEDEVFALMLDVCLVGHRQSDAKSSRAYPPQVIVRRAEERFASAEGQPISLADLCLAAGVSKTTLYRAFEQTCGLPPLDYFHKRKLSRARSALLRSAPGRGAVKRAALLAGLTELGRFSVEYRQLYGESPSATVNGLI